MINELSQKSLSAYLKRARKHIDKSTKEEKKLDPIKDSDRWSKNIITTHKRKDGIKMAKDKLNEISKKTLTSYLRKMKEGPGKDYPTPLSFRKSMESHGIAMAKLGKAPKRSKLPTVKIMAGGKTVKESTNLDEISFETLKSYRKKATADSNSMLDKDRKMKKDSSERKFINRNNGIGRASDRLQKENIEQIDEISKETLKSYRKKANKNIEDSLETLWKKRDKRDKSIDKMTHPDDDNHKGTKAYEKAQKDLEDYRDVHSKIHDKRKSGIKLAFKKLQKENNELVKETDRMSEINEISKKTLGSYIKKASQDKANSAADLTGAGMFKKDRGEARKKYDKRTKGIETAVKKLTKESFDEILDLSESKNIVDFNKMISSVLFEKSLAIFEDPENEDLPEFEDDDLDFEFDFDELEVTEEQLDWIVENITEEEFEQLDEISKKTLGSYMNRATNGLRTANQAIGRRDKGKYFGNDRVDGGDHENNLHQANKSEARKRERGLRMAIKKLTKEETELEEGRGKKGKMRHSSEENEWGEGSRKDKDTSIKSARNMKYSMREESIDEASYSAKAASEGKDIGKPGKNFHKIADKASKEYGSKEAGERVAGAVLAKLRAKRG